jgi:hypothetical protein
MLSAAVAFVPFCLQSRNNGASRHRQLDSPSPKQDALHDSMAFIPIRSNPNQGETHLSAHLVDVNNRVH